MDQAQIPYDSAVDNRPDLLPGLSANPQLSTLVRPRPEPWQLARAGGAARAVGSASTAFGTVSAW
ncbi:hypothetical protein ACH4S8_35155 [Streptomyces sp. NPDC021080]|uniref:hypothetical protein n=1 Tax=Streptomyces sp. NPDC021080 TaxID=3365110 RepID=UPI0037B601C8